NKLKLDRSQLLKLNHYHLFLFQLQEKVRCDTKQIISKTGQQPVRYRTKPKTAQNDKRYQR
ncbi:MAG: hypothetical protein C0611_03025, partial [Desulfobacteraceae bacterium]